MGDAVVYQGYGGLSGYIIYALSEFSGVPYGASDFARVTAHQPSPGLPATGLSLTSLAAAYQRIFAATAN